jgi:flagellar hook-associated protein 3 FlgL
MISSLDPANQQFLSSLNDLQQRVQAAESQLSSGLRVNQASDAPQSVGDIFQARADLAHANQVSQNLTNVKAQADAADSALQSAVQALQQAQVLATQGASSTTTADQDKQLATQVQALQSELVSLSRTQVAGVYIFSGDNSSSPSYQLDPSSPTGVDRLIVTQATQKIADPTGVTFQVAMTAQDLFDKRDASDNPAPENAFAALQNLQTALQSGDHNAITQALGSIQTASAYINQQAGFYGTAQNRISSALDLAQKFQVQSRTELSNLQDADIPTVATELTQLTTSLDAAMAAQAKRPITTLFDYLPRA